MKKKYSNHSSEMRTLYFTDGTAVFMFRGQTVETDKEVVSIPDGVKVKEVNGGNSPRKTSNKQKKDEDEQETSS